MAAALFTDGGGIVMDEDNGSRDRWQRISQKRVILNMAAQAEAMPEILRCLP